MKKIVLFVMALLVLPIAGLAAAINCDYSADGIMTSYQALRKAPSDEKPLQCLLEIHEKGGGFLKILAGRALQPLMGGRALKGRENSDGDTAKIAKVLEAATLKRVDLVQNSLLADYNRGAWGFYDLFCGLKDKSSCTLFLPDEKQVQDESPLLGASSMVLLRTAYLTLKDPDRQQVAKTIQNLHSQIPQTDVLKRRVIEQIYQELFSERVPLAMT